MLTIITYTLYVVGVFAALTILPFLLSPLMPRLTFWARTLSAYLSLLLCSAYGVCASIILRLLGLGRLSQWTTARCFKWICRFTIGVRFEPEGEEYLETRPAVYIANHQTELDILMLGGGFPKYCSVTAKRSLAFTPFLGWFMVLSHTVFINRRDRASAVAAFDGAAEEMRTAKQNVFIFPEGTRSYFDHPDLLPFKKGAFHLAIKAQVPIVPVVSANYSHILCPKKRIFNTGTIPMKILPPISTKGLTAADVDDLTRRTREIMLEELVKLTARTTQPQLLKVHGGYANGSAATSTGVEYGRKGTNGKVKQEI
ncbi:MAG: 1-acylglycerol-3-phosphate O-acyltransferase [Cirrosporium novae-zelandiae]|nr:MAG: 1-acylglycerol-3-phosphate O-acyltransferase [Cirrosporium novae-zelandiae]